MDAATENLVFERLLGPEGLLRKSSTTVIIATHAGLYTKPTKLSNAKVLNIVNLLPSADYIIALGANGKVLEQGTFEQLNKLDGYVKSFSVQQGKRNSEIITEPLGKRTLGTMVASPLVDAMDEKKRQLGDLSVYKYYFRSIGWFATFMFFALSAICGFFLTFPSKLGSYPRLRIVLICV